MLRNHPSHRIGHLVYLLEEDRRNMLQDGGSSRRGRSVFQVFVNILSTEITFKNSKGLEVANIKLNIIKGASIGYLFIRFRIWVIHFAYRAWGMIISEIVNSLNFHSVEDWTINSLRRWKDLQTKSYSKTHFLEYLLWRNLEKIAISKSSWELNERCEPEMDLF